MYTPLAVPLPVVRLKPQSSHLGGRRAIHQFGETACKQPPQLSIEYTRIRWWLACCPPKLRLAHLSVAGYSSISLGGRRTIHKIVSKDKLDCCKGFKGNGGYGRDWGRTRLTIVRLVGLVCIYSKCGDRHIWSSPSPSSTVEIKKPWERSIDRRENIFDR